LPVSDCGRTAGIDRAPDHEAKDRVTKLERAIAERHAALAGKRAD
jgi:hypothetical protein